MEGVVILMMHDPNFWKGRRVFVTGHTGFKGTWLSTWLTRMGAEVAGYALPPNTTPSLFHSIGIVHELTHIEANILDTARLQKELVAFRPEIVFHLAAQALVRHSHAFPVDTFATNTMGVVHLLEAVRKSANTRVVINVTTDKCYKNREWARAYRETDPLGGQDPYSASKACAELITDAFYQSYLRRQGVAVATARAGNVLGGGDWSPDRLIPDAIRSFTKNTSLYIRNPTSTRPWQHVLEPLSGYLQLAERCWKHPERFSGPWNFGPPTGSETSVGDVMDAFTELWDEGSRWAPTGPNVTAIHEARRLSIDPSKAIAELGWQPMNDLQRCLAWTAQWYQSYYERAPNRASDVLHAQIDEYEALSLHGFAATPCTAENTRFEGAA